MIKELFIPTARNKYHAYLLRRPLLAIYLIILILVNFIFGSLSLVYSNAAIDYSRLYTMHNDERAKRGLGQLTINQQLITSATAKAKEMLETNCWSHYCPDGESPWNNFDDAGYQYIYAGENLAEGYFENEAVMTAWMNSPTHRDNILNAKFDEIGIGYANGDYQGIRDNTIIVVHFGSRVEKINVNITSTPSVNGTAQGHINFTAPLEGSAYQNNDFTIEGQASPFEKVAIKVNNDTVTQINVNNGNFTYRPRANEFTKEGEYTIKAEGQLEGKVISSNPLHIRIDRTAPLVNGTDVILVKYGNGYTIQVASRDTKSITITNLEKDLLLSGKDTWQLNLIELDPVKTPSLVIKVTDLAGNVTQFEMNTRQLLNNVQESLPEPGRIGLDFPVFRSTSGVVNFSLMMFLSGLFGIDYLALKKNGLTGQDRSKSHLNVVIFLVLALLLLLGASSGNILSGLTL